MRILFISHYFHPEGNAPASRVFEMSRRWVRLGHQVTVLTCAPSVPNGVVYRGYSNRLYSRQNVRGIDVVRTWVYLAANRGIVKRTANYLSFMFSAVIAGLFVRRPDVIVATSPQFFCGWAGVMLSRIRRVRLVLDIRDIWPDSIAAVGAIKNRPLLAALRALEKRMYAAASHIVTVGEGYRRQLLAKGVPAGRISVVPNGVDGETFKPAPPDEDVRRRWGLDGRFTCAYVGTIGAACGLDVVLQAARILKTRGLDGFAFLLVGDGARKAELDSRARTDGLDNVMFTGRMPKERIPGLLSAADAVLVHLIKADLFKTVLPSKLFEAAAMAKPIILGVEGSAADWLTRAKAGVCIEPENAWQLVEAMTTLAAKPQVAARLGRGACSYVAEHHDREVLSQEYLTVLGRTVESKASRRRPRKRITRAAIFNRYVPHYRIGVFEALQKADGMSFTVCAPSDYLGYRLRAYYGGDGFPYVDIRSWRARIPGTNNYVTFQPYAVWSMLTGRYDVFVMVDDLLDVSVWLNLILGRLLGRGVCLWGHGVSRKFKALPWLVRRIMLRLARAKIAYGDRTKRLFVERRFPAERIFVAYNAVDTAASAGLSRSLSPADVAHFLAERQLSGKRLVLFTGRLQARKRPSLLIRAMQQVAQRVPDAHLVMIGDGPMAGRLRSLAAELGIADKVTMTGAIRDHEQLARYFLAAGLAVMPAAAGLAIQHAFSYGVPIVVGDDMSSHGPEIEAVLHGKTGLYCKDGDSRRLARAICRLLTDERTRARLSRNALELVRDRYNVSRMAQGMARAARSCLDVQRNAA